MNGPFGNRFPYTNFHEMNLDWIIQIAKDFLDQYTHIQDTITAGLEDIDEAKTAAIEALDAEKERLEGLLDAWYENHSDLIENALRDALADFTLRANEVADVVIASIPEDYTALSDNVSNLDEIALHNMVLKPKIISSDLVAGYYSTVDGSKQTASPGNYKMIPYLVRAEENTVYVSNTEQTCRMACFDKDLTYISSVWALTRSFREMRDHTPAGTCYVGLHSESATTINIQKIDSSNEIMIEYPFSGENYIFQANTWMNGYGQISEVSNLSMIVMAGLNPGDKYFVNNNALIGMIFMDRTYNIVEATRTAAGTNAWIYTVPAGAYIAYANIYNTHLTEAGGTLSGYISKVVGPKVLVIGDSLTWLDGHENYGGMAVFSGYQRQLRAKGYEVVTAGWSGYPYADGLDQYEGTYYSLYTEIVTNQYDVTGFDYVILFGGTNDVLYNGALGDRINSYSTTTFDGTKFNGALSAIIHYIRTNNADCRILLASFPKSEAASRIFTNAITRVQEIEYNALFWSCKYINVFQDMNVQPEQPGFDDFFYDQTHPNYYGMQRIGQIMAQALAEYQA